MVKRALAGFLDGVAKMIALGMAMVIIWLAGPAIVTGGGARAGISRARSMPARVAGADGATQWGDSTPTRTRLETLTPLPPPIWGPLVQRMHARSQPAPYTITLTSAHAMRFYHGVRRAVSRDLALPLLLRRLTHPEAVQSCQH